MSARFFLLTFALILAPASLAQDANVLDRFGGTEAYSSAPVNVRDVSGAVIGPMDCGGADQPPCPPVDPNPVPLDGGLSLLALAGTGYAARKLRARRAS